METNEKSATLQELNEKSATLQELQGISQRIGVSLQWILLNQPECLELCRSYLNGCLGQINNLITHK